MEMYLEIVTFTTNFYDFKYFVTFLKFCTLYEKLTLNLYKPLTISMFRVFEPFTCMRDFIRMAERVIKLFASIALKTKT